MEYGSENIWSTLLIRKKQDTRQNTSILETPTIHRLRHAPQPSPNRPQPWPIYVQPVNNINNLFYNTNRMVGGLSSKNMRNSFGCKKCVVRETSTKKATI